MEVGLPESISSKTVLAQNVSADPLCYWQTTNGTSIDLGALCASKSNQHIPTISLTNTQSLTINSIKFIKVKDTEEIKFKTVGTITNTGSIPQRFIEVSYQSYALNNGLLKARDSNKVFVNNTTLNPGETTTFPVEFEYDKHKHFGVRSRFDVLVITSVDSVEEGSIPVNICYSGRLAEDRFLCQRLSPKQIREFG
ncbi:hypothetical protein [Nostoc sp.]|uniref:hypothetical protein n=1 Tax=Nostoc sp. TaxID=1180 RepID=UPI002FF9771B